MCFSAAPESRRFRTVRSGRCRSVRRTDRQPAGTYVPAQSDIQLQTIPLSLNWDGVTLVPLAWKLKLAADPGPI